MGHLEIVRLLLERGAQPFATERCGFTAYELARAAGHAAVVAYLEAQSADEDPAVALDKAVEADDADRVAALAARLAVNDRIHQAVRGGKQAVVEKLLALGCPVDLRDSGDHTPLSIACDVEHLAIVKLLLAAGANAAAEPEGGAPALASAIWRGAIEIVALLLDAGFSPSTPHGDEAPTVRALSAGHPAIAQLLLDRGADIAGAAGAAILTKALSSDAPKLAEMLLAKGVPVDTTSYYVREALGGAWKGRKVRFLDPDHALRHACSEGDDKMFGAALAAGADPDGVPDEEPPLLAAIKGDHWKLAERLLAAGADPDRGDYYGSSIASELARQGKLERVAQLAKAGARLAGSLVAIVGGEHCPTEPKPLAKLVALCLAHGDTVDHAGDGGKTALWHAAAKGHVELARALLDAGARIDAPNEDGVMPLMEAAGAGSLALVRLLVERGADLHAKDDNGTTACMRAARAGAEDVVAWCLEHGASSTGCLAESGGSGKLALVKRFLEVCDLEETDGASWTAAMNAASGKSKKVFELLLARGAKIDHCGIAAAWGPTEHLALALARGAPVDARDFAGRTALIIAASQDNPASVRLLLGKGAAIDAHDEDGETPLIAAARARDAKTCKLLLDAGANRGLRTKDDKTAADHTYDYDLKRLLEV
jgi:ankyrin repeat protein